MHITTAMRGDDQARDEWRHQQSNFSKQSKEGQGNLLSGERLGAILSRANQ